VGTEVISEDIRIAGETLKREAVEQEHAARLVRERADELAFARRILKSGEA